MTNKQESNFSTQLAVSDFFNKNGRITATLPNFGILFPKFESNIAQIQIIRGQQEVNKSGIKDNKDLLRADVVSKAYDVGKKTEVYAKMNNNAILAKEVHYTETELSKASDSKLKDKASLIYNRAVANAQVLMPYGVTEVMLTELKKAIDVFSVVIPSIRIGMTESKIVTSQLSKLLRENDSIMRKFELLVEVVRVTEPIFYEAFYDNRKKIENGTSSLALRALITNKETGEGIRGVKVTFIKQADVLKSASVKAANAIVKYTAKKGIFNIKTMEEGIYIATVQKAGFKEQELLATIAKGEMTNFIVELEKI